MNDVEQYPLPPGVVQMETGPVAFGDEWPGIFIRGDHALALAFELTTYADGDDCPHAARVRHIADLLSSCRAPAPSTRTPP